MYKSIDERQKMKTAQSADNINAVQQCNITFIIGNGFDLNLGMKTKYCDMYDGYIKTPSDSKVIESFKHELKHRDPYDKWSDFEMAMAQYAGALQSEHDLIECVRDFKTYLVNHLRNEDLKAQELFSLNSNSRYTVKELNNSLDGFYSKLIPNTVNEIKSLIENKIINYNFITFNYTSSLEYVLKLKEQHQQIKTAPPIHIHGTLDEDVVLGIDNLEQLTSSKYTLSRRGQRTFVKTLFNDQYDKSRVAKAKKIISESSVICVYGWSLGASDKTWTDLLVNWMMKDFNHHLVIYQYDTKKYYRHNFDEIMDVEDEKKDIILSALNISDEPLIFDQIHIPIGQNIFNFGTVRENQQQKAEFMDDELFTAINT
ncbi:MAG: hypothetical protein E7612_04790 [Ruminococcaceae bacterium]|nr:hypothetical protein [Oscillospiraceae bacterium]